LGELEILVKNALAPDDVNMYETKLKNYMASAFSISEKGLPRIYRFEDFFQAVNRYVEQFVQRIDLLSSTDIILKMDATKATDGYDGSRKIFLQYLPQNYCSYLFTKMEKVRPEDDDIIQFTLA
jgi:hypothetical protein